METIDHRQCESERHSACSVPSLPKMAYPSLREVSSRIRSLYQIDLQGIQRDEVGRCIEQQASMLETRSINDGGLVNG